MSADVEPLDDFRHRVRRWLKENIPRTEQLSVGRRGEVADEDERRDVERQRKQQRMLFDAGLAGIVVPKEYGGAGLTPAHADVFNDEIVGYQYPNRLQVPGMTPCMAILLEFGTEPQKQAHVPRILDGTEMWMQMLSEPSGGSDVAGAQTSAVRDGDEWVLNGSKIWTTGAWLSDWALCLARTNIWEGVCERHPRLRFAFLESGGGWVAPWLDRMDRHFANKGVFDEAPLTMRPSEYFQRQCWISFEPTEGSLPHLIDYIGPTKILWATDYPHVDGFFPGAPAAIAAMVPASLHRAVLAEGAIRFYGMG